MLGESIETSAGDPSKAGLPKHEVGFNPFIIGPENEEGKRLLEIVTSQNIEGYLLNTGSLGKGGNLPGRGAKKIYKDVSSRIILEIARGSIRWAQDPDWGYAVAEEVPGIPDWSSQFSPNRYYPSGRYQELTQELKREREEFLTRYNFSLS